MPAVDAALHLLTALVVACWALGLAWLAWAWLTGDRRRPPRRGPKRWTVGDIPPGEQKHWSRQ